MTGFVIRHNETGEFVALPGSHHSYTPNLIHARRFATREAAEPHACGNEHVVSVDALLSSTEVE